MLQSSNVKRITKADGTLAVTTAYAISLPAHKCFASLNAIKDLGCLVATMGVEGDQGGGMRRRGFKAQFFGTGANNAVVTGIRVYAAHRVEGGGYMLHLLFTLGAVFGNIAGESSMAVGTGEFGIDTITVTSTDEFFTAVLAATGAADKDIIPDTPNDTLATILVADAGGPAAIVFDVDLGASATGLGVLFESIT